MSAIAPEYPTGTVETAFGPLTIRVWGDGGEILTAEDATITVNRRPYAVRWAFAVHGGDVAQATNHQPFRRADRGWHEDQSPSWATYRTIADELRRAAVAWLAANPRAIVDGDAVAREAQAAALRDKAARLRAEATQLEAQASTLAPVVLPSRLTREERIDRILGTHNHLGDELARMAAEDDELDRHGVVNHG